MTAVIHVLCWNIGLREKPMQVLTDSGCDVALIQEAPPCGDSWEREHYGRGARICRICRLSNRVNVIGFRNIPLGKRPGPAEFAVSAAGTIAAAGIIPENGLPFIAISLYARWEKPHPDTPTTWGVGYADAMAHRAISDLSAFIGRQGPCHASDSCRRRLQPHPRGNRTKSPGTSGAGQKCVRTPAIARVRVHGTATSER